MSFRVGQRVKVVNHPDLDIAENQWTGTVLTDPPTRLLQIDAYGEIPSHEYTLETKYLEPIPESLGDSTKRLVAAGFKPAHDYVKSYSSKVARVCTESNVDGTWSVCTGSDIKCQSLELAVDLALQLERSVQP